MTSFVVQLTSDGYRKPRYLAARPNPLNAYTGSFVTDVTESLLFDGKMSAVVTALLIGHSNGPVHGMSRCFRETVNFPEEAPLEFNVKFDVLACNTAEKVAQVNITVVHGEPGSVTYVDLSVGDQACSVT